MVIKILNYIKTCTSNADGDKVFSIVYPIISSGRKVKVSFDGIDGITSSFVNSAFIPLFEHFDFDKIQKCLTFVDSTKQINDMIKKRFYFEAERIKISA